MVLHHVRRLHRTCHRWRTRGHARSRCVRGSRSSLLRRFVHTRACHLVLLVHRSNSLRRVRVVLRTCSDVLRCRSRTDELAPFFDVIEPKRLPPGGSRSRPHPRGKRVPFRGGRRRGKRRPRKSAWTDGAVGNGGRAKVGSRGRDVGERHGTCAWKTSHRNE